MSGPYKVPDGLEQEVTGSGRAAQRRLRTKREKKRPPKSGNYVLAKRDSQLDQGFKKAEV